MNTITENIKKGYFRWESHQVMSTAYTCGYCGAYVSSESGLPLMRRQSAGFNTDNYVETPDAGVYICTNCHMPTFIYKGVQVPGNRYGSSVKGVSDNVNKVYEEARSCYAANAYTGTVLLCRKLLMHVAVDLGADENLNFFDYVNYLDQHHFISVKSHDWIDQIRKYGNDANHEIHVNSQQDAQMILKFCEMLLKMNYEYPSMLEESDNN